MTEAGKVHRHGTGPAARRAGAREADGFWHGGTAARAIFRADLGGWAVIVYGPQRRR